MATKFGKTREYCTKPAITSAVGEILIYRYRFGPDLGLLLSADSARTMPHIRDKGKFSRQQIFGLNWIFVKVSDKMMRCEGCFRGQPIQLKHLTFDMKHV